MTTFYLQKHELITAVVSLLKRREKDQTVVDTFKSNWKIKLEMILNKKILKWFRQKW